MNTIHLIKVIVLATISALASCNTWEGIKQDSREVGTAIGKAAEKTGQAIQDAAE